MGLGAYPGTDRQFLGMPGMHGTVEANMAMQNCDVLLAIGARFDDRVIGDPADFSAVARKIIHVDIDPSSISKRVRVDVPIVGNVDDVLEEMIRLLEAGQEKSDISGWWAEIEGWRARQCMKYAMGDEAIMPQYVIEKLWEITKGDAIITSDVGQHQMWAAQYYKFDQPRRWLNSGGLGTMGVGLPYAIGASFAHPDKQVACITGDGSIQMCIQELSTAKQFGLPIKIVNLNNRYLGMVRQWQEMFYSSRYSQTYMDSIPDFVKLAEAYGHVGIRVDKPRDVEPALKKAFIDYKNDLVFLDIRTAREANVFPMVAAGKGLSQMLLADENM
jgi:acetolactate synthase-1/2/3 large subunit